MKQRKYKRRDNRRERTETVFKSVMRGSRPDIVGRAQLFDRAEALELSTRSLSRKTKCRSWVTYVSMKRDILLVTSTEPMESELSLQE